MSKTTTRSAVLAAIEAVLSTRAPKRVDWNTGSTVIDAIDAHLTANGFLTNCVGGRGNVSFDDESLEFTSGPAAGMKIDLLLWSVSW